METKNTLTGSIIHQYFVHIYILSIALLNHFFSISIPCCPYQVKVTSLNLHHSCLLNTAAFRVALSRSGSANVNLEGMQDVLSMIRVNPTMASNELRPFLARHLPSQVSLDSTYVSNFRQKAVKYLCVHGDKCLTHDEATLLIKHSVTDEAIATDSSIQRERLQELLTNVMSKGDFWEVVKFFEKIQKTFSHFCYSIKKNSEGSPCAIMWCTSEMRRDLIRYGDSLFIDMRKTATNDVGWNYFGPCIMDCEMKVRVVAECLCCVETNDMYAWGLYQLPRFEPAYGLANFCLHISS